jgi:hypothetical protein
LHVLCFQSSAAGSQAYVAEFVQLLTLQFATYPIQPRFSSIFAGFGLGRSDVS